MSLPVDILVDARLLTGGAGREYAFLNYAFSKEFFCLQVKWMMCHWLLPKGTPDRHQIPCSAYGGTQDHSFADGHNFRLAG